MRNKDIKNITISDILNALDKYSSFESKKKARTIFQGVFIMAQKRGLIHENIVPSLNQISGIISSCHSYIDPIDNHCLIDFLIFINKIKQPHIKLALLQIYLCH